MRKRTASKLLSLLLTACMLFSLLPASIFAEDTDTATWEKVAFEDIAADDTVAITMTKGDTTWVLPTKGSGSNGQPLAVTGTVSGTALTTEGTASAFGWTAAKSDAGFTLHGPNGYLYVTATNNGVRIGDTAAVWSITEDYLTSPDSKEETRYLGVYNAADWRCYTSISNNIKDQELGFWKLTSAPEEPEEPEEPTVVDISDALAASSGEFTVKGVVTMVDGKNVYVQDATGGICLFFTAAPSGIALGDTVIGTGSRSDYKGLPELTGASFEKSEGLTLAAKETTLGAITTADICTYVTVKNLTVKEVNGTNATVTDDTGAEMALYKAVTEPALAAGDKIDFTGAVGMFNTLQLRNTVASEITLLSGGEEPQEPQDNMLEKLADAPADGDQLVIYHPDSSMVLTATPSGKKLAGTDGAVTDGKMAKTDEMALLTARVTDGVYAFELDGQFLTSAETGNGLSFAADGDSDLAKWTLEKQTDGTWYLMNVGAEYKGEHNQALEYYSGFTTYGVKADNAAYKFEFFGPAAKTGLVTDLADLTDGAQVVIYNPSNAKGMTSDVVGSDWYLAPADVTIQDDKAVDPAANLIWTVKVNDDGTYSFEQDDKAVTMWLSGTYVELTSNKNVSDGDSKWVVTSCNAETNTFYLKSSTVANSYGSGYIEIYNKKISGESQLVFCGYTTSEAKLTEKDFGMQFYLVGAAAEEPQEPDLNTIAEALAGEADAPFTVKGVVTMVDGKNVYVQDATGGICLFFDAAPSDIALGDTVIGSGKRATYRGLPELTGAAYEKSEGLTLSARSASIGGLTTADVCTYVQLKGLEVTEVYDNNGKYANPNITLKDADGSTIQLYKAVVDKDETGAWTVAAGDTVSVKAAVGINNTTLQLRNTLASEITKDTGVKTGLVTDLADLTDGSYVVIYNPNGKLAMTSETYRDWYLLGAAATTEDGQVLEPAADQVWKVTVNDDGTYTFTQGSRTVAVWLDGTYVELTSNGSYNADTDTAWTLEVCNAETSTFYMSSNKLSTSYGKAYIEVYKKKVNNESVPVFCGYSTSPEKLTEAAYGMQFYLVGEPEEPADKGDLITDLSKVEDGATVAIYSPGHKTAISTKPNGDWYLKANTATVENGKVTNFTSDFVWKMKKNEDGTYSFYSNDDETKSITVWPSGDYAEVTVEYEKYQAEGSNAWQLIPAATADCFYVKSPTISHETKGDAYIEAYVRNEWEVFSGYFTKTSSYNFKEEHFALQFYLVDPDDAIEVYDDGEWDGVLEKGKQYVAYNATAASSIGLFDAANYSMKAIPTTIEGGKAKAGNGAYVFTVDTMGRYYSFEVNGKFLATNPAEELLFVEKDEDGVLPETAKWFLTKKDGGYIIYNKDATYNGTPVCIEYYSSVFSGWTFSTKNDVGIYLFNFYEVAEGTKVYEDVVQDPSVAFDCEDSRYVEQDYDAAFSLDDLAPAIESIEITYTAGGRTGTVTEYEASEDGKGYHFTIPAADIDQEGLTEFTITVAVKNSYGIEYTGEKTVAIIDEPFFEDLTPAPNAQTRDDKRPVISARVGNVGDAPVFTMTVNGQEVEAVFEDGVLRYAPADDMADGRVTVVIKVVRADGVEAEKSWTFIVGTSGYQLYFGQLHSHTTYSDGSGTLDTALDYVASLPESANVQFVAFTDHSNYFDTTSAANPADSLNDKSLMTDASRALWEEYKGKVAAFNQKQGGTLLAIAGYEMTWSGGPGHINTFDSDGLVSRNNADLNNKSGDAGMKLYYETINKGDSLNQFNHPGNTFGNFTDFSYWDEATDQHMFLVEVGNGEGQIGAGGYYPSYEQYILALDKGWHVAPTNNQDNHKGRWGNANDARDVILTNDFSEEGIYDAIRNLRVYATEDKNLQLTYTVNGEVMGTIFTDENAPEKLNVEVTLYDPDAADSVVKVELVGNGGAVAYTWDDAEALAGGDLTAELDSEYSYYFVRVTQKDGDLAVTAPVWVGNALKAGITAVKAAAEPVYKDEEATLVTTLYNNEEQAISVKNLVYSVGGTVIGTDNAGYTIPAGGTLDVNFAHTFDTAKLTAVTVTAIAVFEGKEYTFTATVELDVLDRETENTVTPIADVRAASKPDDTGYRFIIEGVVTSNASGYDKDTAFFDCIYVQDDTAGICCFPVSGEFKIGDKVHIVGHTDFYQSEPELQVQTIEIIGSGSVEPTEITAAQLNDRSAEGKLVTIKGTVESFELANGLIQTIMVKDAAGGLARVFIDGYITTAKDVENCIEGASITVTGLASYDDTFNAPDGPFPRIRIRDRADVICAAAGYQIIVENYAGEKAVTSLTEGASYSGEVAFTVTCDETCLVAVKNADGTYTVLPCTDADGAHTFTVTVADADVTLAIALKGDADLNGAVETKDATLVKQIVLSTAAFDRNEALQTLAGDAFPDNMITTKDSTALKQVVLGTRTLAW
jgi:hypothetical protein